MKRILVAISIALMVSSLSVRAQSSAPASQSAQTGNKSMTKATTDTKGKSNAMKNSKPIPPSHVSVSPDASSNPKSGLTPGSHTAQREVKRGYQSDGKGHSTRKKDQ